MVLIDTECYKTINDEVLVDGKVPASCIKICREPWVLEPSIDATSKRRKTSAASSSYDPLAEPTAEQTRRNHAAGLGQNKT